MFQALFWCCNDSSRITWYIQELLNVMAVLCRIDTPLVLLVSEFSLNSGFLEKLWLNVVFILILTGEAFSLCTWIGLASGKIGTFVAHHN